MSFVGVICEPVTDIDWYFLGGCFAFRDRSSFAACDHVIESALERGHELHVAGPGLLPVPVEEVARHPTHDIAMLRAASGCDPVEPFTEVAAPVVGADVSVTAATRGEWQTLTGSIASLLTVKGTCTAASRGSSPEGREDDPRYVREGAELHYHYPGFSFSAPTTRAFSGAPVIDRDGRVLGHVTQGRESGAVGSRLKRAIAIRLDACLPWIDKAMNDDKEVEATWATRSIRSTAA
jgi:hypothetical protein